MSLGTPLLRLRSDEQLVALIRAGHDEAFRVIHDRYRQRLLTYTRQMLPHRQDAEDILQDVFVRAYAGLRADNRALALRPWLYRVAHNRCIDELRRPPAPPADVLELEASAADDPIAAADQRESLRNLIADLRRLPDHQRSALLMRELGGMSYADLAAALGVSVPAVKSLLVRARVALAKALEARATACTDIQEELVLAHDRGVRPNGTARRHMRDCSSCRDFRVQLRGSRRQLAALMPALGPLGLAAKALGVGGGATSSAVAGGGGAVGAGSAVASAGVVCAGTGHIATLLAAAVVAAGGAAELQHTLPPFDHHSPKVAHVTPATRSSAASSAPAVSRSPTAGPGSAIGPSLGAPIRPARRGGPPGQSAVAVLTRRLAAPAKHPGPVAPVAGLPAVGTADTGSPATGGTPQTMNGSVGGTGAPDGGVVAPGSPPAGQDPGAAVPGDGTAGGQNPPGTAPPGGGTTLGAGSPNPASGGQPSSG